VTSSDLVVSGKDTGSWFKVIGADENVPAWVQAEVAKHFVAEVAGDANMADRAEIRVVLPDLPPGTLGLLIPKTKIYLRVSGIHKDAAVFLAGLLATLVTHGAAVPVIAPGVVGLWTRFSRLTSEQVAMLEVMQRVAEQKSLSLHEDWIPQEDILAAWPTEKRQQGLRLLADLKEAGAISGTGDEWRIVL
jgi:hypothetical protein